MLVVYSKTDSWFFLIKGGNCLSDSGICIGCGFAIDWYGICD